MAFHFETNTYSSIKKVLFIILLLLCILSIPIITNIKEELNIIPNIIFQNSKEDHVIGTLIIKKINLKENLYKINSKDNNVEKHVTILKESIFPPNHNSIIFLAAHSGDGKIAYFDKLDELQKDDLIELIYKNKKYLYQVKNIWEEKKNGYINVNKETENQLVLTTCSPNNKNYQLVVNCIKKESN